MPVLNANYTLFSAQTSTGNGSAQDWNGGDGVFAVWGAFGGTTVKLQWSPDDGSSWLDVDRSGDTFVTFTSAGSGGFSLPQCKIRAVATGGAGLNINAIARGV